MRFSFILLVILTLISCEKTIDQDVSSSIDLDLTQLKNNQVLTIEEVNQLGFDIEGDPQNIEFQFKKASQQNAKAYGTCKNIETCCDVFPYPLPSFPANQTFYPIICFSGNNQWDCGFFWMSFYVDGVYATSIGSSFSVESEECKKYDPLAVYINGEVAGHVGFGPSNLGICPHEIRVNILIRRYVTAACTQFDGFCAERDATFKYPGYPNAPCDH